ncbi:MAG: toll/interleukin-1 receptor domain-containing protein [Synechococcales bacterium]|nr:toll/interleukin-1 receptor domain-containing protein [Synechococcales bacterium]
MVASFQNAFISYGRPDSKTFVIQLHQHLTAQGWNVWLDLNDIPLGVDFQDQIDDGIRKADNFLFIISPHSVNSPYCGKEVELALQLNKRIIPILHVEEISQATWQQRYPKGTEAEWQTYCAKGLHSSFVNMHPAIGKINWMMCRDGLDNFDTFLTDLEAIFQRHRQYVQQHTLWFVKALEWQQRQKQSRYLLISPERQQAEAWLQVTFQDEQPPCVPTDLHCEFISESIQNANNLMTHVFLAYADSDGAIAQQIRASLMRFGLTVWTNKTNIQTGELFQEAIQRGVAAADTVVCLLSPASLRSHYFQQELDYALSLNKRIISLLIDTVEPDQMPIALRDLQYVGLVDDRDRFNDINLAIKFNLTKIIKSLRQDADYYETHKILLVKALKWRRQNCNSSLLLRGYNLRRAEAWLKVAQSRSQHSPTALQATFITESLSQPPGAAIDVFISYSRADSDFARRLNDALQSQAKTTWFDQETIASGSDFQREIYRGIENSHHFLFILSPNAVQSPYCADEVEYACKLNKQIITVLAQPVDPRDLHPSLAAVQWIDFYQRPEDFSTDLGELIQVLETDQAHLETHTRLLMRAIEWENAGRKDSLLLRGDVLESAETWLTQSSTKQPQPTELHDNYIHTSRAAEAAQQRANQILQSAATKGKQRVLIGTTVMAVGLTVAGLAAGFAYRANQQATEAVQQKQEALAGTRWEREGTIALQQFESQQLEALASAIDTGNALHHQVQDRPLSDYPAFSPLLALQTILTQIREYNRGIVGQEQVLAVRFGDDRAASSQIRTWTADGNVRQWQPLGQMQSEVALKLPLWSASFSPDGQRMAALAKDGMLHLWDANGQLLRKFRVTSGASGDFASLSFSPDSQALAILADNGILQRWTLAGQKKTATSLQGSRFSFSPNGQQIATVDDQGIVRLWTIEGKLIRQFTASQQLLFSIAFSPQGDRIVTAGQDGVVRFWSLQGKALDQIKTQQSFILSLTFSRNGQQMAIADDRGTVSLWQIPPRPRPRPEFVAQPNDGILTVQFSPDGQQLLTAAGKGSIQVWQLGGFPTAPDQKPWVMPDLSMPQQNIVSLSLSPDGTRFAIATDQGQIQLRDRQGQPIAAPFAAHEGFAYSVSFSPDGQHLVTAGEDGAVRLWTIAGQRLTELRLPKQRARQTVVYSANFSPDGKTLLIASEDGAVRWWLPSILAPNSSSASPEKSAEQVSDVFYPHPGSKVWSVSISSDRSRFATAGEDGTVRLWSQTKNLLAEFKFPKGVLTVSFSPDGRWIAAGGADGKVQFLPVDSLKSLLDQGCHWLRDWASGKEIDCQTSAN